MSARRRFHGSRSFCGFDCGPDRRRNTRCIKLGVAIRKNRAVRLRMQRRLFDCSVPTLFLTKRRLFLLKNIRTRWPVPCRHLLHPCAENQPPQRRKSGSSPPGPKHRERRGQPAPAGIAGKKAPRGGMALYQEQLTNLNYLGGGGGGRSAGGAPAILVRSASLQVPPTATTSS